MKKKLVSLFLVFALVIATVLTIVACDNNNGDKDIDAIIAEAQNMTTEQLLAKAKEETGVFTAYGTSSRIADAMIDFIKEYGEQLGIDNDTSKGVKKNDSDVYTLLNAEYASKNNKGASMVMVQDGSQLILYREESEILKNYVPSALKDVIPEGELVPLVHQYINKLIIWNKTGSGADLKVTNVWQIVDDTFMGERELFFKKPSTEQVNKNFLIMLTSDAWAKKLADAYKALYNKDIVLDSDCPNAGYQWVKKFLTKANFSYDGDSKIAAGLEKSENAGNVGLFVLSKLRDAKDINAFQVAAWQAETESKLVEVNPFAGFMYPMYCQVATKAPRPYTAMLFINYLMEKEGFAAWGKDWGAYSTNSAIDVNEGDKPLSFWRDTLVIEDASYIKSNVGTVGKFIDQIVDAK